ncbi:hypothetical protein ACFE04_006435 [Oxalis oulophora]
MSLIPWSSKLLLSGHTQESTRPIIISSPNYDAFQAPKVAFTPRASVAMYKAMSNVGSQPSDVIAAIDQAVVDGVIAATRILELGDNEEMVASNQVSLVENTFGMDERFMWTM